MNSIQEVLRKFDLFSIQVQLSFKTSQTSGSLFGVIVSLAIIIINILAAVNVSQEVWLKQQPIINQSTVYQKQKIMLNQFPIVVAFQNQYLQLRNVDGYIYAYSQFYSIDERGVTQESSKKQLVSCDKKLSQFENTDLSVIYQTQDISKFYCVDFDPNDYIYGQFGTPSSQFIKIQINYCKGENEGCVSDENTEAWNIFEYSQPQIICSLISTSTINGNNYLIPFQTSPQTLLFKRSRTLTKIYKIEMGKSQLSSDDGLILPNWTNYNGYSLLSSNLDIQPQEQSGIAEIYFSVSTQLQVQTRTYMKIADALAKISGIFTTTTAIMIIILSQYQISLFYAQVYEYLKLEGYKFVFSHNGKFKILKEQNLQNQFQNQDLSLELKNQQLMYRKKSINNQFEDINLDLNELSLLKAMTYKVLKIFKKPIPLNIQNLIQLTKSIEKLMSIEGILQIILQPEIIQNVEFQIPNDEVYKVRPSLSQVNLNTLNEQQN